MGKFSGCLLACDIDGTLISGELLPERNIEKIKHFVDEGGMFSLSTGRSAGALTDVTSKIKCLSPSVLSNGSVIYDFKNKTPLFQVTLSKKAVQMVAGVIKEVGIGLEMHAADNVFVPSRNAVSDLHEQYESMKVEFLDFSVAKEKKVNKVVYCTENECQAEAILSIASGYEDVCNFYRTTAFMGGKNHVFIEQVPKGVSKADALEKLCGILKIKKGGFFAIGDYYNDVPMLEIADISGVPAEAPDDVKIIADKVLGSVSGGAVADFIDYLEEII
ncbi:MAG: HAD-IIB family hydrolase [Clostridia bacterium]|nr:HAD-IIB family hydrolase [Clostridia bacterium]